MRARRWVWCISAVLCGGLCVDTPPAQAQTGPGRRDSLSADSLEARLARAESAIALLREQLANESSTQVRLRSRFRVDLFARILTNGYRSTGASNNPEVPIVAVLARTGNDEYGSPGAASTGLSLRQSTVGASVSADSVLGGTLIADLELDFFGGASADGFPLFPVPRLRTARGFLRWNHTELQMGTDTPLISDLNPIGMAGVAIPDFSGAGNLWNWLPQIRLTRDVGTLARRGRQLHVAVQAAVLDPYTGDRHAAEPGGVDAGRRSGRPALEGRLRGQWGLEHEPTTTQRIGDGGGEIGVGVHRGWLRIAGDSLTSSWAISADARIGLSHGLEVRGEAYRGRILRGLGGGGIGQNFAPSPDAGAAGTPVTSSAGWLQLNAQLNPYVMTGAGCGVDRVHAATVLPERRRNTVCATHVEWRPTSPLLFGAEYRGLVTRFADVRARASTFNLFVGVEL